MLYYEHVPSLRPRDHWWQNRFDLVRKCLTACCNLNRDLIASIP